LGVTRQAEEYATGINVVTSALERAVAINNANNAVKSPLEQWIISMNAANDATTRFNATSAQFGTGLEISANATLLFDIAMNNLKTQFDTNKISLDQYLTEYDALVAAQQAGVGASAMVAKSTRDEATAHADAAVGVGEHTTALQTQVTYQQAAAAASAATSAALKEWANDTSTASEWVRDLTRSLSELDGQLILTGSSFSAYLVKLNQVKAGYQELKKEEDKLKGPRGFMDSPDDMLPTTIGVGMGGFGQPVRSNVGDPIGSKYTTYDARYGNVTAQRIYDNQGRWGEFIWLPDGTMVESGRQGITFFGKSTGTYGPLVSNFRQYGSNT